MQCPRAVIFDLDDTLAESFRPPAPEMIRRLASLLELMPVAIVSAAGFPRIEHDFLAILSASPHAARLYVQPNSSAQCFTWDGAWKEAYNLALTSEERERIRSAIIESADETGIPGARPKYEPLILDREVQIAYAAIGLDATLEEKKAWDPDRSKRNKLKAALDRKLPDFEVLIGGMTTIDITRKGINKAHGVRWLSEHLNIPAPDMLYVGDALYEGGNDSVVIPTGIQTRAVSGPTETEKVIDELLAACG